MMQIKLYQVSPNTRILVGEKELLFHKIDGSYSICTDADDKVYHIAAWTEVVPLE